MTVSRLGVLVGTILPAALISACTVGELGEAAIYSPAAPSPIRVVMPANAPSITQQFRVSGNRASAGAPTSFHEGIDIAARTGTPVLAAAPGIVAGALTEPFYGSRIVIDHGVDAAGLRALTVYKHLASRSVLPGRPVARGEPIGTMGRSGLLAGGIAHLHFEVRRQIRPHGPIAQDPHLFWLDGIGRVTCFDPARAEPARFAITYPVPCR